MFNLTTSTGVADYMVKATSLKDWDRRCYQVRRANGGYPIFWLDAIVKSGLEARVHDSFCRSMAGARS